MYTAQIDALPRRATLAAQERARVTARVLRTVRQTWNPARPMSATAWFDRYGEVLAAEVAAGQAEIVQIASVAIDDMLREQGYRAARDLVANPNAFAGTTGNGQPIIGLNYVAATKVTALQELPDPSAQDVAAVWRSAGLGLQLAVQTALADTNRLSKLSQLGARSGAGWLRMLRPPSCVRCAILAGKKGGSPAVGFQRHPGCDCDVVPIRDYRNRAPDEDWRFDAKDYFESLGPKEQDKLFTTAGAKAIRDGADPAQVVNARRGMSTTVDRFGFRTLTTTEGTTKRGHASRYLRAQYNAKLKKIPGRRYQATNRPRLMPEEIYRLADGDADVALNLLHKNGFLTDASSTLRRGLPRDAEVRAAETRTFERLRDGR